MTVTDAGLDGADADILSKIRAQYRQLSKSHRRVADIIIADPEAAMQSNVEELSARAAVAKSTVVRFARSAGCDGLKDFKLKLAASLALGANYLHRAVGPTDSAAEVLNNVVGSTQAAIAKWQRALDPGLLQAAAEILNRAARIDCYGTGQTSHFMAQDLHARLFRLGATATVFTDVYLQLVAAAALGPQDAVVAISYVGRLPTLIETIALAKDRGARVIAITRTETPLARLADIVLAVDAPADATMPVGTDAYITQMLMVEMLSIMVGRLRGPDCARRLEAIQKIMQGRDSEEASMVHARWTTPANDRR